jgi:hypothetical protein
MSAQTGATAAAVGSVVRAGFEKRTGTFAALTLMAMALSGCVPQTISQVGADPADPGARVAGVGYRSTIAPYASLRPTTPSGWKEQNQRVTPSPTSGHEH